MKKLALLLALVLLFAGCGKQEAAPEKENTEAPATEQEAPQGLDVGGSFIGSVSLD